jgi:serine protease Do
LSSAPGAQTEPTVGHRLPFSNPSTTSAFSSSLWYRCVPVPALLILLGLLLVPTPFASAKTEGVPDVVENVSKAIVNIRTEEWTKPPAETRRGSLIKRLFEQAEDDEELSENIGSGVVLDPKGIIVTNEHLIARASNIRVKFTNGKEYEAYVLGSDPEFDMALLKITDSENLPYLKLNNQKKARVGEKAIVIGNPYGLSSTVTVGVISATGRNLRIENRTYINLIQTDAAINPGSSGGALLDSDGNPLGIVTAIYGEGKGIGFAIPMEDVTNMLSEFLETGHSRPLLGIFVEKKRNAQGLFLRVTKVIPGGPAEKLGIRVGDNIIALNRRKLKEGMRFQHVLRSTDREDTVTLKLERGTKEYSVIFSGEELERYVPLPLDEKLCGLRMRGIKGYPKLKFKLKEKDGVVATKVMKDGLGERSGLKAGDVILRINNAGVRGERDFNLSMIEGLKRNYILFQVKRGDNVFYLPMKIDSLL